MGSVHASRRLLGGSHAPRTQRASGAGRSRTRAPSVEPAGEEQKRRARLRFWGRAARALSPAPPPASNGRPSPLPCPPLGRAKWRPRHKMAAGPGHERAMTENTKGAVDPLPPAQRCWPELPFGGCRGQPSSDTGASSRPHRHTPGFPPAAPRAHNRRAVPLCGRCLCSSKSPLSRRRLRKGTKLERTERRTPAGPPCPLGTPLGCGKGAPLRGLRSRSFACHHRDRTGGIKERLSEDKVRPGSRASPHQYFGSHVES